MFTMLSALRNDLPFLAIKCITFGSELRKIVGKQDGPVDFTSVIILSSNISLFLLNCQFYAIDVTLLNINVHFKPLFLQP